MKAAPESRVERRFIGWSIHRRLLLVATLVLAAFLGLGALALDRAFSDSVDQSARERLLGQVYALLGAAEEDEQGRMRLPMQLPDPRLSNPDSGVYARVSGEHGGYRWSSASLIGRYGRFLISQQPGEYRFSRRRVAGGQAYVLNFGVQWADDSGQELDYTLAVAEDTKAMQSQVEGFRSTLLYWLGGSALLLLLAQGAVLTWGLRPLRKAAADLKRVETGEIDGIHGRYPAELGGLIRNINALVQSGRASRDRYRNSLGDLAHSLKTPLTLLLGVMESGSCEQLRAAVREQIPRMDEIVHYQLRRAAASSGDEPGKTIELAPLIRRLTGTLHKVYRDKAVSCTLNLDESLRFLGDKGDALEILGNLMDNGFKYARTQLRVGAAREQGPQNGTDWLRIIIEDDGPGIPIADRGEVLQRGVRIDRQAAGQGIGLSVSYELIRLYGGSLEITESELGGASLCLKLPIVAD